MSVMNFSILVFMLFLHIADDFYLQGILASMKQKSWWESNVPNIDDSIYKKDYVISLIIHGFSWSFMIFLPIIFFNNFVVDEVLFFAIILMGLSHSYVDDLKANRKQINLIQDQTTHIIQILLMWLIFV